MEAERRKRLEKYQRMLAEFQDDRNADVFIALDADLAR